MGGMWGTVEGRTKLGTWLTFKKELSAMRDDEAGIYAGGMNLEFPTNKKEGFSLMRQNKSGTGWILDYHLHT